MSGVLEMTKIREIDGTNIWRTPETRFEGLPDYRFTPNYLDVQDQRLGPLRMHYLDEVEGDVGETILLLHGEPSWSYLYRSMIPSLLAADYRVIVPDLIGFGRSDKPGRPSDYTYAGHLDWLTQFIDQLGLKNITLFCQDWGGLLGLRIAAAQPDRFARLIVANSGLPEGWDKTPFAVTAWQAFARYSPWFPIGSIVNSMTSRTLDPAEKAAYDAPFPDRRYKAGTRAFPRLIPTRRNDPQSVANRAAWARLEQVDLPLLTLFSDKDVAFKGGEADFQRRLPGAQGQPHKIIENAGHFLQEDAGPMLAAETAAFISRTTA
jgi:haloalkane dehalogenase